MNEQVNQLVMNAPDEMLAGPNGVQRTPDDEQSFS